MKLKLIIAALGVVLFPALSMANATDLKKLKAAKIPESKNASCKTCHTKGKLLNTFGKAYKESDKDFSKMRGEAIGAEEKAKKKLEEIKE
ncbi:MAG TPA: hypothetical protein DCS07_02525 [Bdellovibrionales bacterium]|nr:MAG: hypothetical protein A2Z97_15260 [Bdellovibrionales bacterium GWB1_52_6]OFZ05939.1 MAG: hypothetical protein A2X97_01205 [Bdellovibrionales bacterium GWA1_52_35]OFZ37092.1 MAG: hypothetical protein A2070_06405 [Bdellovibrionales bacterium GWC1_52_8]HAR41499.1 hypothetical protein [Bdellovibrionales bacterium]HCM39443.1 hypothetical protein [Bdellovibrionales bacterium]